MKRKPKSKAIRYSSMKPDELAEATASYDREMVVDEFQPLTGAARERWLRARRKPGRPRRGLGARVISVSIEQGLLEQTDELARGLGLTRAGLIERGLRSVIAARRIQQSAVQKTRRKRSSVLVPTKN